MIDLYFNNNDLQTIDGGEVLLEEKKKQVLMHLAKNNDIETKEKFPGSIAISFNNDAVELHQKFAEYLQREDSKNNLQLDSINKGPFQISYIFNFIKVDSVRYILNHFFKDMELTRYPGIKSTEKQLTQSEILSKANDILETGIKK